MAPKGLESPISCPLLEKMNIYFGAPGSELVSIALRTYIRLLLVYSDGPVRNTDTLLKIHPVVFLPRDFCGSSPFSRVPV